MITDMLNNKKFNRTTYLRKKTRHFSCFYYTIIFHSNEKCYTKFYAFFITTITTNKGNYSSNLIIHQILTLSTLLIFTRKYTANHIVNDATVASCNPLHFRNNLLERILKFIMTIEDENREEKL